MSTDADPGRVVRPRLYEQVAGQIVRWAERTGLSAGDRLLPERELAARLGVSRATLSQALVALEVSGVVTVRHGDGTTLSESPVRRRLVEAVRHGPTRLTDVVEVVDALLPKVAALAAERRTDADLERLEAALDAMQVQIAQGHRGEAGADAFHEAVSAASRSALLADLVTEVLDVVRPARLDSLSRPGRPGEVLAALRGVTATIRDGDPEAAAAAMHEYGRLVADVRPEGDGSGAPSLSR
jgi:GntR family transcriptional repressor for pyruvate dehydrogenase complex